MSTELKREVMDLVGDEPANIHTVKGVIKTILQHTGEVSSDDVRFYVKQFNPSTMIIGSAFKSLVDEGILRKKESVRTDLKTSKGRSIIVYTGA